MQNLTRIIKNLTKRKLYMIKYTWGQYYNSDIYKNLIIGKNGLSQLRRARNYEIEVYDKSGKLTYINGEKYDISKGDILISTPGDTRQSRSPFDCYSIKFLCNDTDFELKLRAISGIHHIDEYISIIKEMEDIYRLSEEIDKELSIDAKIRSIVAKIYESISDKNTNTSPHKSILDKSVRFIEKNFHKKLSLKSIASASGLSSSYFHKIFKEVYFMSPNDYLNSKRISYAKSLLLNPSASIDMISEKCGFFSRSYFDTTFKKIVGMTPKEYRDSF